MILFVSLILIFSVFDWHLSHHITSHHIEVMGKMRACGDAECGCENGLNAGEKCGEPPAFYPPVVGSRERREDSERCVDSIFETGVCAQQNLTAMLPL